MATKLEERNKAIVQRWIDEVFNSGDISSVDELKVSSYLDWTPLPARYQNVELPVSGIKHALPEWLAALPDFEFTADRLLADGDFVVSLGRWQAHHEGDYKGHTPTGRRVGGTRIDIFRVAGDKMVEHWGCGNELSFLQMVGALDHSEGTPARAEDVARSFVERVLGQRDVVAVAELVDPQARDHSGLALSMLALLEAFPDLEVTVTDAITDGPDVVVTSTVEGTHQGTFAGVAPTGKRVRASRVDRFRVAEAKIVESWRNSDDDVFIQQLVA